jgi:hypothetical protein
MKKRLTILALISFVAPAAADVSSEYTKYDLDKCAIAEPGNESEGYSGTYLCPGYKDMKIYFAEGDLRALIGFGQTPEKSCSFRHTFPRFNTVGNTVEWRLRDGAAFAVIQRWTVAFGEDEPAQNRTWLMVSKIENGSSCHMAAIEGAMPKANEKARAIADQIATEFSCMSDDVMVLARSGSDTSEVLSGPACVRE